MLSPEEMGARLKVARETANVTQYAAARAAGMAPATGLHWETRFWPKRRLGHYVAKRTWAVTQSEIGVRRNNKRRLATLLPRLGIISPVEHIAVELV